MSQQDDERFRVRPSTPKDRQQKFISKVLKEVSKAGGKPLRTQTSAAVTTVRFAAPDDADLAAYIACGEPLNVAGAFTIDGLGGWFIDGVDGDPSNVVGLGLALTHGLFNSVGLSIGDLWAANPVR